MNTKGTCLSEASMAVACGGYHITEYQPDFYYYMITLKNNNLPTSERGFTTVRQFDELAVKILRLTKSKIIREAYELDSKQQLHSHILVYTKKILNPKWLNDYIKRDMPQYKSWMINVSIIKDGYHLQNSYHYLNPTDSDFAIAKYNYNAPNEVCEFIE